MNCPDCRDHLVAYTEHLLDPATAAEFEHHLAACQGCREALAFTRDVHRRLVAAGDSVAGVALTPTVMRRIQAQPAAPQRPAVVRLPRWWFGLGATAAAAAALIVTALLLSPGDTKAQPADVLNRGIQASANLTTVYLQGRMRAPPAENFSYINAQAGFTSIKMWKELDGQKRWRIEKPGRTAWMDGATTNLFLRSVAEARRVPAAAPSAFDTEWLHHVADIEQTLTNGLKMAQARGWKMELTQSKDADGSIHQHVSIDVPSALPPGDYLYNKFMSSAATRRLHRFNGQTGRLEAMQIFLHDGTDYVLVFELVDIAYNQAFATGVFAPALPPEVTWSEMSPRGGPAIPPSDPKYAAMSAVQAARNFLEACARQDWTEAQAYWSSPLNERIKQALGSISGVVTIGEAFSSANAAGQFVPYEIALRNGATKQSNLALRKDPQSGAWYITGGL